MGQALRACVYVYIQEHLALRAVSHFFEVLQVLLILNAF